MFSTPFSFLSLGFAARWRSSRQEGGDQKQDPGDREDGPCLLCAQVGNIFFPSRPTSLPPSRVWLNLPLKSNSLSIIGAAEDAARRSKVSGVFRRPFTTQLEEKHASL